MILKIIADDRLTVSRSSLFQAQIGPTPANIQVANGFPSECFDVTVDNENADGHVTFSLNLFFTGTTTTSTSDAVIFAPNATIRVLDNDCKVICMWDALDSPTL